MARPGSDDNRMINHFFSQAWLLAIIVTPLVASAIFSTAGYKW